MATTKPLSLSLRPTVTSAPVVYTNGAGIDSTKNGSADGNGYSAPVPENTSKRQKTKPSDDLTHTFLIEPPDDDGNAKCAYAMFGDKFLYCEALGWQVWTGTHWKPDPADAAIDRAIMQLLRDRRLAAIHADKEHIVKATQGTLRRVRDTRGVFRSMVDATVDSFDDSPDTLNCANGVLNLRTGELTPHSAVQRFTYCLSVEYDPTADDSDWKKFLEENVEGGPEIQEYLQMAVGYSITGHTNEECLWYIYGPSRSGKGIFTEVMLALLGSPLGIEVDFATFTSKREGDTQNFDLAPLKPTRLVVTSESNKYETLNAGKIKQLTGGNYIRAALKHRDLFTYRPQFKPWLVSNLPVNADVDDDALWYRVKVLEFPNSHIGAEDKTLKVRMRSKDNLRGVLKWAVEGAMKWYAAPNGLVPPPCVSLSTQKHRDEIDYVGMWLEECTTVDEKWWTSNDSAYQSYKHWCIKSGVSPKQLRGFLRALRNKALQTDAPKTIEKKTHKGILGRRIDSEALAPMDG